MRSGNTYLPANIIFFFQGEKNVGQGEDDMGSKRKRSRDRHAEPCDRIPEVLLHAECRTKIETQVYFWVDN